MTDKLVELWESRFAKGKKAHDAWRKEAKRIQAIYDQESNETSQKQSFNMLWSNTQIQHGALYSNTAKPDIRKRYTDSDQLAKEVGTVLERAIQYCQDVTEFDPAIDNAVDDALVAGLGITRVRIEAETGVQQDEFGNEYEAITHQVLVTEHISWRDFGFQPATRWSDVDWCWIRHKKDKATIKKEFGVTLDEPKGKRLPDKVDVFECFDRKRKEIVILAKGQEKPLAVKEDKLNLKGFYPFTKPIFFFTSSKSLCPQPEYIYYEPQANNLDTINARIKAITAAIKEVGVYDSSISEDLGKIHKKGDGYLAPIENLVQKLQGASFDNVIATLPLDEKQRVLAELREQAEAEKQEIYELTGISDIIRGATSASESATAQSMKGHYADMRFSRKTKVVNQHIRSLFRIMAELIAEHFTPEILTKMTGVDVIPEMDAILKDEVTRNFVIDVESDSTVAADEQNEREQKLTFLQTTVDYLNNVIPAVQSQIMPMSLAKEIMLMVISGWKHGRALEDLINSLGDEESPEHQLQQLQGTLQQYEAQMAQLQQDNQVISEQANAIQADAQAQVEAVSSDAQGQIEALQSELAKAQEVNEQLKIQVLGQEEREKAASAELKEAQAEKVRAETQQLNHIPEEII